MSDTNESQVVIALRSFLKEYEWDTSLIPPPTDAEVAVAAKLANKAYSESFNALEVFTNGKF